MAEPIDLIIFDCDGVLVESERFAVRLSVDALARAGWTITDAEYVDLFTGRSGASSTTSWCGDSGRSIRTRGPWVAGPNPVTGS